VPFAQWYNTNISPKNPNLFYRINPDNFLKVFGQNLATLTGKNEITLSEFCGHVAIILNETGGRFEPLREYPAHLLLCPNIIWIHCTKDDH